MSLSFCSREMEKNSPMRGSDPGFFKFLDDDCRERRRYVEMLSICSMAVGLLEPFFMPGVLYCWVLVSQDCPPTMTQRPLGKAPHLLSPAYRHHSPAIFPTTLLWNMASATVLMLFSLSPGGQQKWPQSRPALSHVANTVGSSSLPDLFPPSWIWVNPPSFPLHQWP